MQQELLLLCTDTVELPSRICLSLGFSGLRRWSTKAEQRPNGFGVSSGYQSAGVRQDAYMLLLQQPEMWQWSLKWCGLVSLCTWSQAPGPKNNCKACGHRAQIRNDLGRAHNNLNITYQPCLAAGLCSGFPNYLHTATNTIPDPPDRMNPSERGMRDLFANSSMLGRGQDCEPSTFFCLG